MIESNKELEQIKSEMEEIRKMLGEIKENTAYFKGFMEKYNIPMQEEEKKDIPAEESLEEEMEIAPVQPTEEIPEEEEPEITEDEEEKKVCIAQTYILYNSTQYKPGDVLPANDPEMLAAWLEAGTAKWLVTALAGMYGTAVSSDSEDGEDLVGRVPHNSARNGR